MPTSAAIIISASTAYEAEPRVVTTRVDRVPDGEVEIRRASEVLTSDEHVVGSVDGFVFDPDGRVTHLVLDQAHLWGRRDVTIPIEHAVKASREFVRLDVTRQAVDEFPSVAFDRPDWA